MFVNTGKYIYSNQTMKTYVYVCTRNTGLYSVIILGSACMFVNIGKYIQQPDNEDMCVCMYTGLYSGII